jgi:hypothetical protein
MRKWIMSSSKHNVININLNNECFLSCFSYKECLVSMTSLKIVI